MSKCIFSPMSISTVIFFKKDINVKSLTASEIWQNQTKIHHHGTNAHAAICGSQNEQRKCHDNLRYCGKLV